ncbi:hypothetical protein [Corynebacterium sp. HMSC078H07]|uniref:hypothetical protein n=1 Tax=Corynebacterium sp. HMSC078H07 TaxID=1739379 RepID=UPI0008A5AEB2|nr:hypothetical protein [Corynebacterium sp. HMSC078H07]OFR63622.1 hypothetical protein HMPREF2875_12625 [Corynebacterium sp. HMSC078H07]
MKYSLILPYILGCAALAACSPATETTTTDHSTPNAAANAPLAAEASIGDDSVPRTSTGAAAVAFNPGEAHAGTTDTCATENAYFHTRYGLGAEGATALRSDVVPRLYFTVTDGGYNPCAPISYSVLSGTYGNLNGPGGLGSSIAQGLIVWSGSTPLANTGVTAASIENVQVLSDDTLQATFGRRGGTTAEGITERATVQLQIQGDQLVPISGDIALYNDMISGPPTIIP